MSRALIVVATAALLFSPAGASPRPCRDANGRVVKCVKATSPAPARCKDDKGRFVKCPSPPAKPKRP